MGLVPPLPPLTIKMPGYSPPPDDTLLTALKDYHVIQLETDDDYNEKLTWCLEHCQNKFRDISHSRGRSWYFQNEQDATMFSLKWA
jgi:hypothetical protein